jgi:hypothetical protein
MYVGSNRNFFSKLQVTIKCVKDEKPGLVQKEKQRIVLFVDFQAFLNPKCIRVLQDIHIDDELLMFESWKFDESAVAFSD